jgi:formylglycine-generating enzyme required for sulfatase activity
MDQLRVPGFKFQVWHDGKLETWDLEPETIAVRLPTGEEWVAAAGGEEGERYPWGPDWDEGRVNTEEGGIDGTTPVAMYPSGQSPPGVWDMGGNVWEWMGAWCDDEHQYRALRGGSWYGLQELARVRARLSRRPDFAHGDWGFRVVVSPAEPGGV